MVKLNRIYTRTGDTGTTGLGDGARVSKDAPRVEAYGEVDEANSAIGMAIVALEAEHEPMRAVLEAVQHDLFDVGADLCCPVEAGENPEHKLRVQPGQTERLEGEIDRFNQRLSPLTSFVLPGGSSASAHLHLARTIVRRAERRVATLLALEPSATSAETLRYLNRLSDLLFVLARVANGDGSRDVLWKPGKNRG